MLFQFLSLFLTGVVLTVYPDRDILYLSLYLIFYASLVLPGIWSVVLHPSPNPMPIVMLWVEISLLYTRKRKHGEMKTFVKIWLMLVYFYFLLLLFKSVFTYKIHMDNFLLIKNCWIISIWYVINIRVYIFWLLRVDVHYIINKWHI